MQFSEDYSILFYFRFVENNQTSHDSSRTPTPGATSTPSPPPEPIDWRPSAKCNFCVNGRLLTVNAQGKLVAESAATATSSSTSNSHIHQVGQLSTQIPQACNTIKKKCSLFWKINQFINIVQLMQCSIFLKNFLNTSDLNKNNIYLRKSSH